MPVNKKTTAPKTRQPAQASKVTEPKTETVIPSPKEYKNGDKIKCVSTTAGLLIMYGIRTGAPYRWVNSGDEQYVDYEDLVAEIRSHSNYIYKPRFVVDEDEFVAKYPDIKKLYDSLYSKDNLKDILNLSPDNMRVVIEQLPDSVKGTIKSLAVSCIDTGEIDSVKTIKTLDEIFGTQMLLKMTT